MDLTSQFASTPLVKACTIGIRSIKSPGPCCPSFSHAKAQQKLIMTPSHLKEREAGLCGCNLQGGRCSGSDSSEGHHLDHEHRPDKVADIGHNPVLEDLACARLLLTPLHTTQPCRLTSIVYMDNVMQKQ